MSVEGNARGEGENERDGECVIQYSSHQLSLFGRQRRRREGLVPAAEGVAEAVHFLKALPIALLINAFALRHLVEDGRRRLGVVLHKLHVLQDCERRGRRRKRSDEADRCQNTDLTNGLHIRQGKTDL